MVKTGTYDITQSKKKEREGNKKGILKLRHFPNILNFFYKRFHRPLSKILIGFFGIVLAMAILEAVMALTARKTYDLAPCTSLDLNFHHVMIPRSFCRFKTDEWDVSYRINSLGLRGEEIGPKDNETQRILFLGDSFVQGHGTSEEKTLPKLLEEKFKGDGRRVEVINAGVYGYSPLVEYLYLKKQGLKLEPDLVLLGFSVTDFWEDRKRLGELAASYPDISSEEINEKIASGEAQFNFEKINTAPATKSKEKIILPGVSYQLKEFLKSHFRTYAALVKFVKSKKAPVQKDILHQGDIDLDIVAIMRGEKIKEEDWQVLWEKPMKYLAMTTSLLKENEIPFVVVMIPDSVQVSDMEWPGRKGLGYEQNFADPRGPFQDELAKRLARENIAFIDLLGDFKKSNIFPLYFKDDGHWRESGSELASQILAERLGQYILP